MVIRDVLNSQQIKNTVNDVWNTIVHPPASPSSILASYYGNDPNIERVVYSDDEEDEEGRQLLIDREDPETWTSDFGWPSSAHIGLLGSDVASEKSAFEN